MPCVQIKTNAKTTAQSAEEIKKVLGQAISFLPGKSESWLMVSIEDQCRMYFGGRGDFPVAMVEVKILGDTVDREGAEKMTEKITQVLGEVLGVAPDHLYIKYEASPDWGWNGKNF